MKPSFAASDLRSVRTELLESMHRLEELERKFKRQEHVLFPRLEPLIPSTKPLQVLWSVHDRLRTMRNDFIRHLETQIEEAATLREMIGEYYITLIGLLQKEELILFPIASELIASRTMDGNGNQR
ncbi:MAG: hemerythrin domain-containing protein [Bacillus subtilis]|nr:hemerythrin domain-containing protein [Bacillus subtilis]